jgi:hypothetical protein
MTTQMIDTPAGGPASHSKMTVDFAASLGKILSVTDLCEETTTSMSQALEQVRQQVVDVVSQTEAKIDALARHVSEPADGHEGAPGSDGARRTPWDMVPEIVQELCQPLTVLNCTIEMLQDERFGVVNVAARQALELASDCTRRMKDLADRLVFVCGVPGSLEPDKGCLG